MVFEAIADMVLKRKKTEEKGGSNMGHVHHKLAHYQLN
jgi:hypothetical protein